MLVLPPPWSRRLSGASPFGSALRWLVSSTSDRTCTTTWGSIALPPALYLWPICCTFVTKWISFGLTKCIFALLLLRRWIVLHTVGYHFISLQYTSGMFFVLRPLRKPNDKVLKLFFSCKVHPVTKMITFTTNFEQKRSRWRQTWNTVEISTILTTRQHTITSTSSLFSNSI